MRLQGEGGSREERDENGAARTPASAIGIPTKNGGTEMGAMALCRTLWRSFRDGGRLVSQRVHRQFSESCPRPTAIASGRFRTA